MVTVQRYFGNSFWMSWPRSRFLTIPTRYLGGGDSWGFYHANQCPSGFSSNSLPFKLCVWDNIIRDSNFHAFAYISKRFLTLFYLFLSFIWFLFLSGALLPPSLHPHHPAAPSNTPQHPAAPRNTPHTRRILWLIWDCWGFSGSFGWLTLRHWNEARTISAR